MRFLSRPLCLGCVMLLAVMRPASPSTEMNHYLQQYTVSNCKFVLHRIHASAYERPLLPSVTVWHLSAAFKLPRATASRSGTHSLPRACLTKTDLMRPHEPVIEVDMHPLVLSPEPKPKGKTHELLPSRD